MLKVTKKLTNTEAEILNPSLLWLFFANLNHYDLGQKTIWISIDAFCIHFDAIEGGSGGDKKLISIFTSETKIGWFFRYDDGF